MQTKHLRPLSLGYSYVDYEHRQTLVLVHTAWDGDKPGMARHGGTEEDKVRQLLSSNPGENNAGIDYPCGGAMEDKTLFVRQLLKR